MTLIVPKLTVMIFLNNKLIYFSYFPSVLHSVSTKTPLHLQKSKWKTIFKVAPLRNHRNQASALHLEASVLHCASIKAPPRLLNEHGWS